MEKIVKMIDGMVHTSGCTLRCEYCYLAQNNCKNEVDIRRSIYYPLETIRKACSKKRLGGTCCFQIIGDGETLLPEDVIDLVCLLLEEGHYVKVITNGTLTERVRKLIERVRKENWEDHLLMSLSLHFLELEKRNLLDKFAESVKCVKENGVSCRIAMTCSDEFVEAEQRIHHYCKEKLGCEHIDSNRARKDDGAGNAVGVLSKYDKETYCKKVEKSFPSLNLISERDWEELDNHQFCYAGSWYFKLDFTTGMYG